MLDEADNAVSSINGLINNLPYNLKGKIHFLLAARDSDWSASEASALLWSGCMFVEEKISGLLPEDALSIVECWRNYGELGLGELKSTPDDEQTDCLISASKRDEGASGSAFFGALLKVRYGNDLHSHAKKMLQRLAHRKIPSGGTLKDALGYIAAMDAVGLEFLSRQVLAYTINCPEERLRRDVLFPLGEEAAATITSEHIYTRHPLIAQTLTSVLASEFGEDIDDFYLDLARSALELRVQKNKSVNELGSWRYKMADYFLESGRRDLALKIALTVLHVEPDNSKILTKVAQMYRRGGENEEACELYKEFVTGGKKILERGVFDDWSLSERASKNFSESALLLAFSLADQLFVLPPTIFNIKDNLQSICYDFKQLYELYRVSFFRELVASASRISLCLELTEEQENFFLKNAEELGVDVNTVSYIKGQFTNDLKEAVAILPEYIMSDAIQEYIGAYGELSFNKLDKIMERMVVEK